jgi:predicted 3-demethylubiquinone-9 3-methyltransferase (glyoxalase superfamily)
MQRITPCLWFDDQAQEAAEFYTSLFPDSGITDIVRYGEAGPGEPGTVMTVVFTLNGQQYVGLNGGPLFSFDEAVSFQIHVDDQAELDRYWAALTEGGEEGPCGWLKDRFGLSWQVTPVRLLELIQDPDPARAQRAMAAMLQMKKIDIAAVEAAAAG